MLFEKLTKKSYAKQKADRVIAPTATIGPQRKRRILEGGGADPLTFDPLDISSTATLELWLDASKITGMSDGDDFTTSAGNCEWSDQSGNSVAISSPGPQGNVASYQTNIINGLPAIKFEGPSGLVTVGEQVYANIPTATFKDADLSLIHI